MNLLDSGVYFSRSLHLIGNIMNKEYWQDDHIVEDDGKFICYDEVGRAWITTDTRKEAREQLDFYSKYILNNITD